MLGALVLAAGLIIGWPLVRLGALALVTDDGLGFGRILEALESRSVRRALWNSFESSVASALIATLAGGALALVVAMTDVRAKGVLVFCILLPMMIPPHVTAIAWIQALGPSSPLLQTLGIAPDLGATHPLNSRGGVIALLAVQHTPLVFLTVRAALRALPREIGEAARVSGAGPARLLRRIVLPLLAPSLIAGFALAFVSALGNFGIPALLGIPARYTTLPVLLWQRLASFGPGVLSDLAVIAALTALLAAFAIALPYLLLGRRGAAALIGPPQPALALRLGRARPAVEAALWSVVAAALALPLAALLATALSPTYGVPLTRATITLDNFAEVLLVQSVTARAFVNSTLAAGGAALALAFGAALLGYFAIRPRGLARRLAAGVSGLADIAYAVPGIVVSIAFILVFIRPLPILGVSLYGTLGLIFLAYLCAFWSIALKPVGAAAAQLDPSLDDAARVSGAGFGRRLGRVFLPLVAPAAASGAILVFLTAYNEITVSTLLWSTGAETIGTVIFNYEDGGYTTLAAAMSAVTVAATVALMVALDRFGRRLPAGVVPWR